MVRLGETPMKDQMPPEQHARVVNAHLKCGLIEFFATDWLHPTRKAKQGNTVCMYLNDGTYEELRRAFDRLAVGGDEALIDELRDMPFGSYGHLADRFGVHWFFQGERSGQG